MAALKTRWFWPVFATVLLADCSTKELVVSAFGAVPGSHPLLGQLLRITLAYNPDAAMNFSIGGSSRVVFGSLALLALVALFRLYHLTRSDAVLRAVALALVAGGALGNLLDRLRSAQGVVDFIDVGVGPARFWIFNIADLGVTVGALLLALVLWREDRAREARA
jgi:signal peptidase II